MNTLAQIAASYGVGYAQLATIIGIDGVDPRAELNDGQAAFIVKFIESSSFFASAGRHRF